MREKRDRSQLETMKRPCNRSLDRSLDISSVYFLFFLTYQLFFYRTIFSPFSSLEMPPGRPKVELDCFREEIQEMRASDTIDGIVNWLSNVHNITVSRSTMKRKLQEWQTIIQERTEDSPQLRARLAVLFYEVCLKDDDMMRVLIEEGYQITLTGLVRLRKELNMTRKVDFRHREEADRLLLDIAQKELDKGEIDGYGISHLYTYFRTKQFNISRFVHLLFLVLIYFSLK